MKRLKIALIGIASKGMREEIGICYICGFLRQNGYEVKLLTFSEINEKYLEEIINYEPELIGVCVYTPYKIKSYELCKHLKEKLPKIKICFGGREPTDYADEILEEVDFVDYIVRGEGELTFLELAKSLENKKTPKNIDGISYKVDGKIVHNKSRELISDLDILPYPSRDLLVQHNLHTAIMSTTRGCKANCSFCVSPSFWKTKSGCKWRGRNPVNVVDEMEHITKQHSVVNFLFSDNSFEDPDTSLQRPKIIANEILKRGMKIYYATEFRPSIYRYASHEVMSLLKRSGLVSVFVGIEAGNNNDLKLYNKGTTVEDNKKVLEFFRMHDINVFIGFINFNPYSCFAGLRENAAFLEQEGYAGSFHHTHIYKLYKNTALYNKLKQDKLLIDKKTEDGYEYMFANESVGLLAQFIVNYFTDFNDQYGHIIDYFSGRFKDIISCCKRYFAGTDKEDIIEYVKTSEINNNNIFQELNIRNSIWFKQLIDLAETDWSNKEAECIIHSVLSNDYLIEKAKSMVENRNKLHKQILKYDRNFDKIIDL